MQQQQNSSFRNQNLRKQRIRGLKNEQLLTPLNGFAFGEGSGVSFTFGNSLADTAGNPALGASTAKTIAAGGGFGGGVGYVNAANVGSAYGGGNGGGNVTNAATNTNALDEGVANSTFNGVSSGGGFGSGVFGGLFVLDPDLSLSEALAEAADGDSKNGKKGKDEDVIAAELEALNAGFYGSFGNTTGGGGGGFGFTGLYASGTAAAPVNGAGTPFATSNSGVNASAAGFGFGGGKTNIGNATAAGGGFGGGTASGAAGGGIDTILDDGSTTAFNATGGGAANGGGAGFVGIGLNPADVLSAGGL